MAEIFVDTLGEKVMVVIAVDVIPTFKKKKKKSPKIAGKYESVCEQRVSAVNTRS